MLYIKEPPDALARLLPTEERMRRIDRSVEIPNHARKMTIASKAGTNLTVNLTGALIGGSYGFCSRPGSWANWGQGLVAAFPASPEVDGDVVLVPGDIIFPFYKYVESSVCLRLKGGFVEAIDGDGVDAELMHDYMARWSERNAYGIFHVGWGFTRKHCGTP